MKRFALAFLAALLILPAFAQAEEVFELWPGLAPGETVKEADQERPQNDGLRRIHNVTNPTFHLYRPEKKTSDALMLIFPGGGYNILAASHEGSDAAVIPLEFRYAATSA